ncbi:MAG: hypothetical protein QOK49_4642, partial [Baekduia sp.]|nr:hypothetical protein [Baekduia sp.]
VVLRPSPLGKAKTTVQFLAVALAMVRPDVTVAGAYLDEWVMVAAAAITVASGLDYLLRSVAALSGPPP